MSTTTLIAVLATTVIAGCRVPDDAGPSICAPTERAVILGEQLELLEPSTPFEVPDDRSVWIAVLSDSLYDDQALFSAPATLYVIDAGTEPQIGVLKGGTPNPEDPATLFNELREYRRLNVTPGNYQLYSGNAPTIEVVSCP